MELLLVSVELPLFDVVGFDLDGEFLTLELVCFVARPVEEFLTSCLSILAK